MRAARGSMLIDEACCGDVCVYRAHNCATGAAKSERWFRTFDQAREWVRANERMRGPNYGVIPEGVTITVRRTKKVAEDRTPWMDPSIEELSA